MRTQRANTIGRLRFTHSDTIFYVFWIKCRKPDLILYWCYDFVTILVSQVRKKFHAKFSRCCWKCSVFSLFSIIFIRITEWRWVIHLLSTGRSLCPYVRTYHGFFKQIFQWQTRFCWAMATIKLGLNTVGFFLMGAFKILATRPATIEELKRRITMEIQNITQKTLQKVFQNMMRYTVMSQNLDGVHFQHML